MEAEISILVILEHNPDEFITESDTAAGAEVLLRVIENFQLEDGSCLMDKTCVS